MSYNVDIQSLIPLIGSTPPRESQVPTPWGHIAVKEWGSPYGAPVLCLHDLLQNSTSFCALIPLFSSSMRIITIDLPGHGKSSFLTPGLFYNDIFYLMQICRIQMSLSLRKFSILGHGKGGELGLMYAAMFPENASRVCVLLDSVNKYADEWFIRRQREVIEHDLNFFKDFSESNKNMIKYNNSYTDSEKNDGIYDARIIIHDSLNIQLVQMDILENLKAEVLFIIHDSILQKFKTSDMFSQCEMQSKKLDVLSINEKCSHFNRPGAIVSHIKQFLL